MPPTAASTKYLPPEERLALVKTLEKQKQDIVDHLLRLKMDCYPHTYKLRRGGMMVECLGCGDTKVYNSEIDKIVAWEELPTIQKPPRGPDSDVYD